jgi:thioredoxin reductase
MTNEKKVEVIIIGGSYAGLSAAMALGRSLRKVLIIDSGQPCNQQTPHSHNFITQDGETPQAIANKALAQVLKYDTVKLYQGLAVSGKKTVEGFEIITQAGYSFSAKKLLFATGITDLMPALKGFAECWGISVLHCPYCHGYEVKEQHLGLIGNGDMGFEFCRLLHNWSGDLTLFTNGKSTLTAAQTEKIKSHNIEIIESEIGAFEHQKGKIQNVVFQDNSKRPVTAIFARVGFKQHCELPETLGCDVNEQGLLKVDDFFKTTVAGIYAAGDNTTPLRAVSAAVAAGTKAGAFLNKELIEEEF